MRCLRLRDIVRAIATTHGEPAASHSVASYRCLDQSIQEAVRTIDQSTLRFLASCCPECSLRRNDGQAQYSDNECFTNCLNCFARSSSAGAKRVIETKSRGCNERLSMCKKNVEVCSLRMDSLHDGRSCAVYLVAKTPRKSATKH